MQTDILIAVRPKQVRAAILTLNSMVLDCDIECRLAVLMHGGIRRDFSDLDEFLVASTTTDERDIEKRFIWHVAHERQGLSYARAMDRLGLMKKSKLATLVEPGVVMNDEKWFGKMQQTFLKDPRNMATIALSFVNSTLQPNRAFPNAIESGRIVMGGMDFPTLLKGATGQDFERFGVDMQAGAKKLGGTRWTIESVRYLYSSWQEKSECEAIAPE